MFRQASTFKPISSCGDVQINNAQQKNQIRQQIRKRRLAVVSGERTLATKGLLDQLLSAHILTPNVRVACFLSFDGEIDTKALFDYFFEQNIECFLPKLKPFKPNRLWFMPYSISSKLQNNRFGIPEVNEPVNHAVAVSWLDIVLMPLVAFDRSGNRLGMGGGFYDATFSHLTNQINRPKFIGLAYDFQCVEELPSDSWDLPLDGILTPSTFIQFS